MTERLAATTEVWEWIKTNKGSWVTDEFTAQQISLSEDPEILDALWALVAANKLRPTASSQSQFRLTGFGAEAFGDEGSPYAEDEFVRKVSIDAPCIDADAEGYLTLGLSIISTVLQAAVALLRAGLELEVNSLIGAYIAAGHQTTARLRNRDLSERIAGIVIRLPNLLDSEEAKEFDSCCTTVRLGGNRVLHPSGGILEIDRTEVTAVFHAFRRMTTLSSGAKATMVP